MNPSDLIPLALFAALAVAIFLAITAIPLALYLLILKAAWQATPSRKPGKAKLTVVER